MPLKIDENLRWDLPTKILYSFVAIAFGFGVWVASINISLLDLKEKIATHQTKSAHSKAGNRLTALEAKQQNLIDRLNRQDRKLDTIDDKLDKLLLRTADQPR